MMSSPRAGLSGSPGRGHKSGRGRGALRVGSEVAEVDGSGSPRNQMTGKSDQASERKREKNDAKKSQTGHRKTLQPTFDLLYRCFGVFLHLKLTLSQEI